MIVYWTLNIMANLIRLRGLVKEIIELSSKSPILADPKSKLFCNEYSKLSGRRDESPQFFKILAQDFGLQPERLHDTVKPRMQSTRFILISNFNSNIADNYIFKYAQNSSRN